MLSKDTKFSQIYESVIFSSLLNPKTVFCSLSYQKQVTRTVGYIVRNSYALVFWLNYWHHSNVVCIDSTCQLLVQHVGSMTSKIARNDILVMYDCTKIERSWKNHYIWNNIFQKQNIYTKLLLSTNAVSILSKSSLVEDMKFPSATWFWVQTRVLKIIFEKINIFKKWK